MVEFQTYSLVAYVPSTISNDIMSLREYLAAGPALTRQHAWELGEIEVLSLKSLALRKAAGHDELSPFVVTAKQFVRLCFSRWDNDAGQTHWRLANGGRLENRKERSPNHTSS